MGNKMASDMAPRLAGKKLDNSLNGGPEKTVENGAIFGPKMAYKLHWKFLGWPGSRP